MEKKDKIIYWVVTGLFSAMMLMNVVVYIVKNDMVSTMVSSLGFPVFIIYPLALCKFLGIVAIVSKKSNLLKEWAYAGFFFTFCLAFGAHFTVGDGGHIPPLGAMLLLVLSRIYDDKVFGAK